MEPMFFFYLTLGAMLFLVVSILLDHGHAAGHGPHQGHGMHHGMHHGGGHGHHLHHGHATGHAAGHRAAVDNMSVWSFQMLFLFIGGFGIGGYFAALYRLAVPLTMACGATSGIALAAVGYFIINIFYRRQANSNIYSEEFIGLTGIIVTSIQAGGVGQVRCEIGTSRETFLAKSVDGNAIPINAVVRVTDMVGSTAIVQITDADQPARVPWRR